MSDTVRIAFVVVSCNGSVGRLLLFFFFFIFMSCRMSFKVCCICVSASNFRIGIVVGRKVMVSVMCSVFVFGTNTV